jgi:hypothetical protein
MKLKLKAIVFDAHSGYSETTLYDQLKQDPRFSGDPGDDECYLFVSRSGTQMIWFMGFYDIGEDRVVIDSRRTRLQRGSWHPWMMQEYAKQAGIQLSNVKTFEERFNEWKAER